MRSSNINKDKMKCSFRNCQVDVKEYINICFIQQQPKLLLNPFSESHFLGDFENGITIKFSAEIMEKLALL